MLMTVDTIAPTSVAMLKTKITTTGWVAAISFIDITFVLCL